MSDDEKTRNARNAVAAMILDELSTHDRFKLWVTSNYQIHVMMNEDEKRVEVKVIEEPLALAQENLKRAVAAKIEEDDTKIQVVGAGALSQLKK